MKLLKQSNPTIKYPVINCWINCWIASPTPYQ